MKQLLDYLPLIFFFIVYKMEERIVHIGSFEYTLGGIFSATEVLVACTILLYGFMYLKYKELKRSQLITLVAVILFCSFTIIFRDEAILKWKAPVVNWIFAAIFLGSNFVGKKTVIQHMLDQTVTMPNNRWVRLNLAWACFFLFLGCTNLYVAFNFHEYWVDFKVFGSMGLVFLFTIGQIFYIYPYLNEDSEEISSSEKPADKTN